MKNNFTKRLSLVLCVLLLIASLPAGFVSADVAQTGAQSVENYYGTDFSYKTSYNGKGHDLYITDYTGSATDLVIPDNIWDYPVKGISDYAFASCKNLVSVTIPDGVESIGSGAFQDCTALKTITIPPSVAKFGSGAFSNCTSLTSVYISDIASWCNVSFYSNYDSNPLYYAKNLYVNNSLVTSVTVPSGVTTIPMRAFDCENITSITLPSTVTKIEMNAFASCKNLKTITIPNSVTEIGNYAFYACDNLKTITVPESVAAIGDSAFANCNSLESINVNSKNKNYTSLDGVLYNKDMTLLICYPMNKRDTAFVVPEGVETIGKYAFYNNRKLESIVLSEGVTQIQNNAFEHTFSLADITIPKTLTRVDSDAFTDSLKMENVYISDIAAWCSIQYGSGQSNPLTCANELYIDNKLVGDVVIPEGVESIADYAFSHTSITSVTFPESLKKIGNGAFNSCTGLKYIEIPEGVTTIPSYAFGYCNLECLTIPMSVTSIQRDAFYSGKIAVVSYCGTEEQWNNIGIASGNGVLEKSLYYNTKQIIIADGVKYRVSTNNEAEVMSCTGDATEVVIPYTVNGYPVKTIKAKAFYGNETIESVVMLGVETIEKEAFARCVNLASVSIPSGIVSIEGLAFEGCTSLNEISVPDSIESIGAGAFRYTGYYSDEANWTDGALYIDNALVETRRTEGIFEVKPGTRIIAESSVICGGLDGIKIPSSIEYIGTDAFINYDISFVSVYITDIVSWCNIKFASAKSNPLYYAKNLYINDVLVSELVIPEEVTFVPAYAFACENITSLTISESVEEIENHAFHGCKNLKQLTTAYTEEILCTDVSGGCESLETVTITEGVTSLGDNLFRNCSKLSDVTIPDTVEIIGEDAFSGCTALTSADIPHNVKVIGEGAFSDCPGLTSIDIPDSVTDIEANAFADCTGLTSVDIPDKVTRICNGVFRNCTGLTSIAVTDGVKTIGDFAFEGCTGLVWVYIPESVTEIGWDAFEGCTGLWHVLYSGTQQQWNTINVSYYENEGFMETARHYSATKKDISHISKEGSCLQDGYEGVCCGVCGEEKHTGTTSAAGHNFENGVCTGCGGYLESAHPYANNMDECWTIYHENAESISITFSEDTYTESGCDNIYIYDSEGYLYCEYNGYALSGCTVTIEGNKIMICMTSDSGGTYYGFRITDISVKEKQPSVYTDEDTAISVEINGDKDEAVELVAQEITDNQQIADVNIFLADEFVEKIYDITLRKDGMEIQPDKSVKVRIPAVNENSKVYRVETDGTVTDMNAVYEDGYLVFTTEHFSLYVVASEKTYNLGDVNLDGSVNVKDATTVQKWVAGLVELSAEALAVADTNADGTINVKDATTIQKKIAGII